MKKPFAVCTLEISLVNIPLGAQLILQQCNAAFNPRHFEIPEEFICIGS